MTTTTLREAQHNLAALIRRTEQGETIAIRRRNRIVARLIPVSRARSTERVDWSDLVAWHDRFWGGRRPKGDPLSRTVIDDRGDR